MRLSLGLVFWVGGVAIVLSLLAGFASMAVAVFFTAMITRALGYWTQQFNVPAWRGQDDPMPFELAGAAGGLRRADSRRTSSRRRADALEPPGLLGPEGRPSACRGSGTGLPQPPSTCRSRGFFFGRAAARAPRGRQTGARRRTPPRGALRVFGGKGQAMEYGELKEQINGLGERQRRGCAGVLSLVPLGGGVRPEFRGHLDGASTYREVLRGALPRRRPAFHARLGRLGETGTASSGSGG